MTEFEQFSKLVHNRYTSLAANELYVVGENADDFWNAYLASFPEGTNPIYLERTEHDCSCCKNFIRNLGNVVAIINGKVESIWDVKGAPYPYDVVAKELNAFIHSQSIVGIFRSSERKYGASSTLQQIEGGNVKKWNHFYGDVNNRHRTDTPAKEIGDFNTTAQVFKRGLEELKAHAFETVIDLINAKSLYRGAEHLDAVKGFFGAVNKYAKLKAKAKELFILENLHGSYPRFKNSSIGSLVEDLSNGIELEAAVRSFEQKVAPENYKRTTALITPRMVQDAMKTITEMGLESALERRFAKISDITVNNVLWVNNSTKGKMKGGIEGLLMDAATKPSAKDAKENATEISIEDFMAKILPTASSIEVLFKNAHQSNLMSVTAPVHEDSGKLLKWGNDFGWSYNGNVTDSIKERVKKAGGSVTGDVCCRLAWEYKDDLDFHMAEPHGGHIYFPNRRSMSGNGGVLDLDANGADGQREDPAENIVYSDKKKMRDGTYELSVNNYARRSDGSGFEVEVEIDGQIHHFSYDKVIRTGETVKVAQIVKKNGELKVVPLIASSQASREAWGLKTETFVGVSTLMFSPNFWDDNKVGNKHWFFIVEGCKNNEAIRGIYNEFLNSSLDKHRKVFEVVGEKTKCQPTEQQLSGLGFSSTKGDKITVKVADSKSNRTYTVAF